MGKITLVLLIMQNSYRTCHGEGTHRKLVHIVLMTSPHTSITTGEVPDLADDASVGGDWKPLNHRDVYGEEWSGEAHTFVEYNISIPGNHSTNFDLSTYLCNLTYTVVHGIMQSL